jgi:diguanylate cyclase (GGDEF)-like protein
MRGWAKRWIEKYLGDSPLVLASGLSLVCVPAVVSVVWVLTGYWAEQRIETAIQRQTQQIARQLTDAETDLETAFGQFRSITTWVAEEGHTLRAILKPNDAGEENEFLQGIAASFGLDLIYVMNAKGLSIAASNWDTPASTIGKDYTDREHYQTAMTGVPGRQFAVGRTTHIPGFFFSMPVRNGDEVVGTVGVKVDQPRIQHLIRIAGSVVTDDYGVIVLSDNPRYMFYTVPDAIVRNLSEEQRMKRYARKSFDALPVKPAGIAQHPEIMLLDGAPVLTGSRTMIDIGLTIHVASDFDALHDAQQQRFSLFIVVASGSILLVWGLWVAGLYFLRARHYRHRLESANTQLSRLNNELHEQATHDYLTGTLNRRAFSALLETELERIKRYGGDLSLAAIDIDYFKRVNDTRGHEVGDIALRFLVDSISQRMRRSDVLARLGGEEFILLMPSTPKAEAIQVVDRMRETISELPVPGLSPELKLTFSAGVAGWRPGTNERSLLNAADQALYAAKGSGRNRVLGSEE